MGQQRAGFALARSGRPPAPRRRPRRRPPPRAPSAAQPGLLGLGRDARAGRPRTARRAPARRRRWRCRRCRPRRRSRRWRGMVLASSRLSMPRALKLPPTCRCSSLSQTSAPCRDAERRGRQLPQRRAAQEAGRALVERRAAASTSARQSMVAGAHEIWPGAACRRASGPWAAGTSPSPAMPSILRTETAPSAREAVDHLAAPGPRAPTRRR